MGTEDGGDVVVHSSSVFQRMVTRKVVPAGAATESWIPVAFTDFASRLEYGVPV
jgi:hypothetical protein